MTKWRTVIITVIILCVVYCLSSWLLEVNASPKRMSVEDQIVLMQQCYDDAGEVTMYGSDRMIVAATFFEYRTK